MRKTIAVIALTLFSLSPTVALSQDQNEERATALSSRATAEADAQMMRKAQRLLRRLGLANLRARSLESADIAAPASVGDLCAFAQIQGPAGSFNIQPVITNFVPEELEVTIIDVFSALGNASLLIESVFAIGSPPGGTLVDDYPGAVSGSGPAVLLSTGWGFGESAFFNLDPDSYDDPGFGATVAQMTGTRIELVYDGARRCAGTLVFNTGLNASTAFLTQTSPSP